MIKVVAVGMIGLALVGCASALDIGKSVAVIGVSVASMVTGNATLGTQAYNGSELIDELGRDKPPNAP